MTALNHECCENLNGDRISVGFAPMHRTCSFAVESGRRVVGAGNAVEEDERCGLGSV